ncbi:MAG: PVC-type heme-binding CxxCH protein, partial [Pirellulaceae bacterium]
QRTPVNAAVWRYHPTRHQFDVFAQGSSNPWGVDFNQHGQAFITTCVIPHLFHVIQGARYQRQGGQHFNPYLYDDIKTIADHAHYVGNIRDHAWWGGKEPILPTNTSSAGGGHAHCGAMIYLADNWPEKYRNHIYFNNVHGNRVNSDILERTGSGFVGRHGKDLLLANDQWFRGINLKYGPDGSVHLIDWYDKNACHRRTPEIWDRSNGRIYRIRYGETKHKAVDLSKLTNPELVKLQLHQNEWYVRTARRLLQERRAALRETDTPTITMIRETVGPLREIMSHHDDPTRQLRAMWTLHSMGLLTLGNCLDQLNSPNEYVRGWAIQLMTERCLESGDQLSGPAYRRFTELARQDPSPVVRLYLASTLQKIPPRQRWSIAAGLLLHAEDADDHNLPLMIWYGIEPLVTSDVKQALAMSDTAKIPLLKRYIIRRAATDNQTLEAVISRLNRSTSSEEQLLFLEELLVAFQGRVNIPAPPAWQAAYEKLSQSSQLTVRNQADQVAVALGDRRIFPKLRKLLIDPKQEVNKRQQAMEMLIRGRDQQAAPVLQTVVTVQALRATAIRALAAYDDPATPQVLLKSYGQLNVSERRDAINTLVSRPAYALALLDAVKNDLVSRSDIHAYNIRQLMRFDHEILRKRIASEWGQVRETSVEKQSQITRYKTYLTPARLKKANLGNGRRRFAKSCAACHTLFDVGGKIGPNLTGSNRVNIDYILENMVDPGAVLGKDYQVTVIVTADGRVISGLIQKETDSALTLQSINDTVVIAKDDIDERILSQQSMLPDGLLKQLTLLQIRDLVGYLASDIQVPLRGPASPIDPKTGRVPDAIEAEKMKIVGQPPGRARSQVMSKFSGDTWSGAGQLWWTDAKPGDRLTLELPVDKAGRYDLEVVLSRARDYGIVQLLLDNQPLGGPIDLYNSPQVITTGVLTFGPLEITPGKRQFTIQIVGSHPKAIKSYMMGLDYVRLQPAASASK